MSKLQLFLLLASMFLPLLLLSELSTDKQQLWDGTHYAHNSSVQFSAGKQLLDSINFKGNESVLDIGCGAGVLAALLAEKYVPNGYVTAVDADSSMIEKAQKTYTNIPNLTILQQDATKIYENTNLGSNKYDVIISVFCLHWIPDSAHMQKVLNGVERCLKPGGRFIAVFYTQDDEAQACPQARVAKELISKPKWQDYFKNKSPLGNTLSLKDYQEILDKAGLEGVAKLHKTPPVNLSEEQLKGAIATLPFCQYVPEELKAEFLEDFFDTFSANNPKNEDHTHEVTITSGAISAYKPLK